LFLGAPDFDGEGVQGEVQVHDLDDQPVKV
jgi:hypothetical protein